uniref:Vacuolar protein sorting-associated protein 72 homolog n=1 Tax=Elaeophora elaphi TaxID=1147741 RepID=A0A158Q7D5_9BILA
MISKLIKNGGKIGLAITLDKVLKSGRSRKKKKHKEVMMKEEPEDEEKLKEEVEEMEVDDDAGGSDNDDESGTSSVVEEHVELMVTNREKRSTAGNKMAQLMESAEQEDEFYKNTYGGRFLEDDVDDAFESPVESDHDEVDSDFDRPEEEDEPISDTEEEPKRRKRKTGYKEPKLGGSPSKRALLEKNKKWVMARMGCLTAAANTVSPETQAQYLEEAKETERKNVASLKKYEQFELEKKKKREKINVIRKLKPPYISTVDGPNGKWMVVPDIKKFVKPERVVKLLCCVTSRPAKYRDPLTGLPFATPEAFKLIREKYEEYLKTMPNHPAVKLWLSKKC